MGRDKQGFITVRKDRASARWSGVGGNCRIGVVSWRRGRTGDSPIPTSGVELNGRVGQSMGLKGKGKRPGDKCALQGDDLLKTKLLHDREKTNLGWNNESKRLKVLCLVGLCLEKDAVMPTEIGTAALGNRTTCTKR